MKILSLLFALKLSSPVWGRESLWSLDNWVEAMAGDTGTGKIYLQAKDAFGDIRMLGEDDNSAEFRDSVNPNIQYRCNVG